MINLFYAPHACSLVSHITLEEAGAAYTAVRVDFAKSEQRQPEYLAINPKERVRRVSAMRACTYARVRETRSYVSGCPPLSLLIEKHGGGCWRIPCPECRGQPAVMALAEESPDWAAGRWRVELM